MPVGDCGRPNMRLVPIKKVEQQGALALRRVRQGFWRARMAQSNQVHGLLAGFGIIVPQGISNIAPRVPAPTEDVRSELPGAFQVLVRRLMGHLKKLDRQVHEFETQIQAWHRNSESQHPGRAGARLWAHQRQRPDCLDRRREEIRRRAPNMPRGWASRRSSTPLAASPTCRASASEEIPIFQRS